MRCIIGVLCFAITGASSAGAQGGDPRRTSADALLDQLLGAWRMTGQVRGEPVRYRMTASRTLAGRFVELHMIDTAPVPAYEARVFIGADSVSGRILAHWLDSFGAAFSVPHGVGAVRGDTLQFEVAYADGPFRDTFVYRGPGRGWHFRLEAGDGRGGWTLFAEYDVTADTAVPR